MPRAASAVRAGEDGGEGAVSMAVCAKMVSGDLRFGPKIHIAFPRNFSNRLVMDIMDEINDFLAERLGGGEAGQIQERAGAHCTACSEPHGGHDSRPEVKENTLHRPAPVMLHEEAAMKRAEHETVRAAEPSFAPAVELEYVPFPREGTVTMKEIVAAWKISQATYYRHMDIYPKPLKFEGLSKNAPARFDAAAVRHAFECGHVERRRREVRLG